MVHFFSLDLSQKFLVGFESIELVFLSFETFVHRLVDSYDSLFMVLLKLAQNSIVKTVQTLELKNWLESLSENEVEFRVLSLGHRLEVLVIRLKWV